MNSQKIFISYAYILMLVAFSFFTFLFFKSFFIDGNVQSGYIYIYLSFLILTFIYLNKTSDLLNPVLINIALAIFWLIITSLSILLENISSHRDVLIYQYNSIDYAVAKYYLLSIFYFIVVLYVYKKTPDSLVFFKGRRKQNLLLKKSTFIIVSLFWLVVGLLAFYIYVKIAGGLGEALTQRSLSREHRVSAEIGAHYNFIMKSVFLAPLTWYIFDKSAIRSPFFWFLFLFTVLLGFFVSGSRGGFLIILFLFFMVYYIHERTVPVTKLIILSLVAIILIGYMSSNRSTKLEDHQNYTFTDYIHISIEGVSHTFLEASRRGSESSGAIGLFANVPDRLDYQYGKTYLSVPFVFIPSAILPFEKPSAAGYHYVNQLTGRTDTAWPIGPLAEAYWNFSYLGVLVLAIVVGFFYKLAYNTMIYNNFSPVSIVIFLAIVFRFSFGSDELYSFFHFIVFSLLVYFSYIFINKFKINFSTRNFR